MNIPRFMARYVEDCRTFPGDAALAYDHNGWRGVWDTLAPRTVHRLFRTNHVLIFAQSLDTAADVGPPAGVRIAPLGEADWSALSTLVTQRDETRFRALAAAGHHCVVAWRGSQPIGYGWVARQIGPDVAVYDLPLPDYAAYLWDLYVLPSERSNGVGSALASARMRTARELGFSEGWRMISPTNGASLRTLTKTAEGSRLIGELRYIKVLSRVQARFTAASNSQ
ncbi:MAG TPA: GNAT family N-acetyltransferase [Gemmatimonadales bacterium]|nr:GNAT family N-acetyltransferase [Gemmatimonadales bacterium]